jgi:hypothetical protein
MFNSAQIDPSKIQAARAAYFASLPQNLIDSSGASHAADPFDMADNGQGYTFNPWTHNNNTANSQNTFVTRNDGSRVASSRSQALDEKNDYSSAFSETSSQLNQLAQGYLDQIKSAGDRLVKKTKKS